MTNILYDIAISYASEDLALVSELVASLEKKGVKTFFATNAGPVLIGERLGQVLPRAYGEQSRFVLVVLSESYMRKTWTRFELEAAQKEEQKRNESFILPIRIDNVTTDVLSSDRVIIDLREHGIEKLSVDLLERVKLHRGELSSKDVFANAFSEWKLYGFVPGDEKGRLFFENIDEIALDIDRCEFLLRCRSGQYASFRKMVKQIPPELRVAVGERLLKSAETPGFQLSAIGYIGSADPEIAEMRLREIYEDKSVPINDRARAFSELRKCNSPKVAADSYRLVLDLNVPWEFRRAAAINVLWGPLNDETKRVLAQAINDPRLEVRLYVVDAIMKFKLAELAPALMEVYRSDRSRKSKLRIKGALQLFNDRQDVIDFGREMKFGAAFFKPPAYIHDWEKNREDWI